VAEQFIPPVFEFEGRPTPFLGSARTMNDSPLWGPWVESSKTEPAPVVRAFPGPSRWPYGKSGLGATVGGKMVIAWK